MDKYKFVLNHKIELLEKEIEPKEMKIGEMKQQILAMEEELTAVVKDQANSDQHNAYKMIIPAKDIFDCFWLIFLP